MRKTQILLQTLDGLLGGEHAVLKHAAVDPVAVLHGLHLVLVAEREPVVHPFVGGIRIVLDVGIGEDLHAVGAHVLDLLEAILEGLFKPELGGVAVEGDAAFRTLLGVSVHNRFLLSDQPSVWRAWSLARMSSASLSLMFQSRQQAVATI